MRVRDNSDASDKPISIDFISGFVHNSSLVTPYNLTKSQPERWESYIYHTAPATTLEHCAALCQITVTTVGWTCNIFSWDATTCYLANHNKVTSSNINGPPGLSEIYITPCMFPNILTGRSKMQKLAKTAKTQKRKNKNGKNAKTCKKCKKIGNRPFLPAAVHAGL